MGDRRVGILSYWGSSTQDGVVRRGLLILSSLVALAAILGLMMLVAGLILIGQGGRLNMLYPLGALLVGVLLYLRHPALYVGFVWWLWFLTPEVRRLVDYQSG